MEEIEHIGGLKIYEVGFHFLPTFSEERIVEKTGQLHDLILKNGGEIISEGLPELIGLAYDIVVSEEHRKAKYHKAYFGWIKFEITSEQIANIERVLKAGKDIMRFIIVKTVRENTMFAPKSLPPQATTEDGAGGESYAGGIAGETPVPQAGLPISN